MKEESSNKIPPQNDGGLFMGASASLQFNQQFTTAFDREFHARLGSMYSLSPASLSGAYVDWLTHLSISPGKQLQLMESAWNKKVSLMDYNFWSFCSLNTNDRFKPLQQDRRFSDQGWQTYPFNVYQQAFLLTEQWWDKATSTVRGVSQHHSEVLTFLTRQYLDMWAPSNFALPNPQVVETTIRLNGANLIKGTQNLIEDVTHALRKEPPVGIEKYKVGKNLATTKGKVIYQNRLIELIQYSQLTENVYADPILIIPAWIMKYYILDLSPHNSLVQYLLKNNHTVFMISWKNPSSEDRDLVDPEE